MSKKRQKPIEPPFVTGTYAYWAMLAILVIVAAGLHIVAMVLYDWRLSGHISFTYRFRDVTKNHNVGAVKYGLYKIWYDSGKAIMTWNSRIARAVEQGNLAFQIGQAQTSFTSLCPDACQNAIKTRIKAYNRIRIISLVLLAVMAVSGGLASFGATFFFIFGGNTLLLFSLWAIAAVACGGVGGYWYWETNEAFYLIVNTQQFPFPALGLCWYLLLIGTGLYLFAAIFVLILDAIDKHIESRHQSKMMNSLNAPMCPSKYNDMYCGLPPMMMHPQMGARPSESYGFPFGGTPVPARIPPQNFEPRQSLLYSRMGHSPAFDRNQFQYPFQRSSLDAASMYSPNFQAKAPYPSMMPPGKAIPPPLPMPNYYPPHKMA